jgi:hypothetical protein
LKGIDNTEKPNKIVDSENRYDKFEFYLLLLSKKSLATQSLARMRTILNEFERHYLCASHNNIILAMIICNIEKGRMGDTFLSKSFRYFDLRARYQHDAIIPHTIVHYYKMLDDRLAIPHRKMTEQSFL